MEVARLTAVIEANTNGFSRAMKGVDHDLDRTRRRMGDVDDSIGRTNRRMGLLGGTMGRVGTGMAVAGAAGAAAVGVGLAIALRTGIGELRDFQTNMANTEAGLKSTKGVANVTAKGITDLSAAIEKKTGVDGDQIHAGQNLLLTFVKVRNEVGKGNDIFNRATQAAVDLQQRGFGSVESSSKMLGKALNDPVKGITALSRAGVTFTAKQKESIKAMVESGNTLGAQKAIMAEVEKQVGGSAEAYGKTLPGAIDRMKRGLEAVAFTLTTALAPAITSAVNWALANFPKVEQAISDVVGRISPVIRAFTNGISAAFASGGQGTSALRSAMDSLRSAFVSLTPAFTTIMQMAQKIAPVLGQYLASAFTALSKIAAAVMPIVAQAIEKLGPPLARLTVAVLKIGAVVLNVLGTVIPPLVKALAPIFGAAFGAIGNIIDAIASLLEGDFTGAFRAAKAAIKAIWITIPGMLLGIIADLAGVVLSKAMEVGKNVVQGITDGIASLPSAIKDKLTGLMDDALSAVKSKAKIFSPSQVWADEVGKPLGQGIIVGFLSGAASLPDNVSEKVKASMDRAKTAVESRQSAVAAAFGKVSALAMRAFDEKTQQGIRDIAKKFEGLSKIVNDEINGKIKTAEDSGRALTPAEAELKAMQDAHDKQQREQDKADALAAIAKAQSEGDAQAILEAQRRYNELLYDEKIAGLQKAADEERRIRDEETAKKVEDYETDRTNRLAALQAQQDDETRAYEMRRESQRAQREEELSRLEAFLNASNKTAREKRSELRRVLGGPGMKKIMEESGSELGKAFATALDNTGNDVIAAARRLARKIQDYLKLNSPAKKGPLSTLDSWWTAMPDTLLSGVDTGMIGQVAAGIAAPDGSAYGGAGSAAGTTVINVTVQGTVTSERELVDTIRSELLKTGQRNGTIFGSYA